MNYSAQYHVFPATFHVTSRKVEYLWDSVRWIPVVLDYVMEVHAGLISKYEHVTAVKTQAPVIVIFIEWQKRVPLPPPQSCDNTTILHMCPTFMQYTNIPTFQAAYYNYNVFQDTESRYFKFRVFYVSSSSVVTILINLFRKQIVRRSVIFFLP